MSDTNPPPLHPGATEHRGPQPVHCEDCLYKCGCECMFYRKYVATDKPVYCEQKNRNGNCPDFRADYGRTQYEGKT